MVVDGSLPSAAFTECLALDKEVFAECISVLRVLLSVNTFVTKSWTLLSTALDRVFFAECPTKKTRQSAEHSAKPQIPVVEPVKLLCDDIFVY